MGTIEPPAEEAEKLCKETVQAKDEVASQENEDSLGGPKFIPPLYLQRYTKVARIVEEFDVKKVIFSYW